MDLTESDPTNLHCPNDLHENTPHGVESCSFDVEAKTQGQEIISTLNQNYETVSLTDEEMINSCNLSEIENDPVLYDNIASEESSDIHLEEDVESSSDSIKIPIEPFRQTEEVKIIPICLPDGRQVINRTISNDVIEKIVEKMKSAHADECNKTIITTRKENKSSSSSSETAPSSPVTSECSSVFSESLEEATSKSSNQVFI